MFLAARTALLSGATHVPVGRSGEASPRRRKKVSTLKTIGSLMGGAAVVAVAIGLTAGLVPASAAPEQSPGVSLMITDDPGNPANYLLKIRGAFPMTEDQARDRLNELGPGGGMDYVIHADDPGDDGDERIGNPHGFVGTPGPPGGALIATPNGLGFYREISVTKHVLDEDFAFNGTFDDDTDEIYVFARFVPGTGAADLGAYTNEVSGDFED
jgi:hypothetical protein